MAAHISGTGPFRFVMPLTKMLCLALMLAVTLSLSPPALAQVNGTAAPPNAPITTTLTPADDRRIQQRLRELMRNLDGYENVEVSVRGGVVVLSGRVLSYEEVQALDQLAARVEGVVAVNNAVEVSTDIRERVAPVFTRLQQRAMGWANAIPVMLVALLMGVLVAWLGFRLARLKQPWNRVAPNEFVADVVRQVVRLLAILAGVVIALDILGASALLGTVLGAAGIFGLAVGFAVRDSVENFIASVLLSLRSPFRPRDLIEIGGDIGHVVRLTSRATILISPDGNHISIPNATVFKARIINYSRHPNRRFTFDMIVPTEGALDGLDKVMLAALKQVPSVLAHPGPSVWITGANGAGAHFRCVGWVSTSGTNFEGARSDAILRVTAAIEAAGARVGPGGVALVGQRSTGSPDATDLTQSDAIDRIVEAEIDNEETKNLLRPDVQQE